MNKDRLFKWAFALVLTPVLILSATNQATASVAYLRPNGGITKPFWTVVGAATSWQAVGDVVTDSMTPSEASYIAAEAGANEPVEMSRIKLAGLGSVTAQAWFFTPTSNKIEGIVRPKDGSIIAQQTFATSGWHSFSVPLNGTQFQMDELRMEFRVFPHLPVKVAAAFIRLELELPLRDMSFTSE